MLVTHQAVYKKGKLILPKDKFIPEGSKVFVTILSEPKEDYFLQASEEALDKIWKNDQDDIYEELLKK